MKAKEIDRHIDALRRLLPTARAMGDTQFEIAIGATLENWRARYRQADKAEREADGCHLCGAYHNEDCRRECGHCPSYEEAI